MGTGLQWVITASH